MTPLPQLPKQAPEKPAEPQSNVTPLSHHTSVLSGKLMYRNASRSRAVAATHDTSQVIKASET
jgi:hypothetical protein